MNQVFSSPFLISSSLNQAFARSSLVTMTTITRNSTLSYFNHFSFQFHRSHSSSSSSSSTKTTKTTTTTTTSTHSYLPSDMTILPIHPESSIRRIQMHILPTDSKETIAFKKYWEETMDWHHHTWLTHHRTYMDALKEYQQKLKKQPHELTDQDKSQFYNIFLNQHYQVQKTYYFSWLKKLSYLIYLDAKHWLSKGFQWWNKVKSFT